MLQQLAQSLLGGHSAQAGGQQQQRGGHKAHGASLGEQEQSLKPGAKGHDHSAHGHAGHGHEEGGAPCAQPAVEQVGSGSGPMSADAAQNVLTQAFSSYRSFNSKKVHMLPQAQFQAQWDKFYGNTQYAWDKWVKNGSGNLNGFAYGGESYINTSTANIGTVPHEMLHVHTAADYMGVCGSPFTEGSTDYLKQYALQKAGIRSPNSYANQMKVVEAYVAIASQNDLFTAYLKGGAKKLIADKVDKVCGSWAEVKAEMDAGAWDRARAKLTPKAGASAQSDGQQTAGGQNASGQTQGAGGTTQAAKKPSFWERLTSWFKRK